MGPVWDGGYRENFSEDAWKKTVSMVREIIDRADVKNTYFTLEPMPWMIPTGRKSLLMSVRRSSEIRSEAVISRMYILTADTR